MVRREIEIEASPDEVWEKLTTESGREDWLDEADQDVLVATEEPGRLVWYWWHDDAAPTRVEFTVTAVGAGTRVVVTETAPVRIPLTALARAFSLVAA